MLSQRGEDGPTMEAGARGNSLDLHNDQVPGDQVWAVVSAGHYEGSAKMVDWFITAEASRQDYREAVDWIKRVDGVAERWQVDLPRRRMERDDVTLFIEEQVLSEAPTNARRLDVFSQLPEKEED
jgi:acyl transferase domain-containing protein